MKTVFMGTPDFAVPPLRALVEAGYEVAAVVTQPDKPKGRGKTLLPTPVKEEALMHEIPVYQPRKVRNNPEFLESLCCLYFISFGIGFAHCFFRFFYWRSYFTRYRFVHIINSGIGR